MRGNNPNPLALSLDGYKKTISNFQIKRRQESAEAGSDKLSKDKQGGSKNGGLGTETLSRHNRISSKQSIRSTTNSELNEMIQLQIIGTAEESTAQDKEKNKQNPKTIYDDSLNNE